MVEPIKTHADTNVFLDHADTTFTLNGFFYTAGSEINYGWKIVYHKIGNDSSITFIEREWKDQRLDKKNDLWRNLTIVERVVELKLPIRSSLNLPDDLLNLVTFVQYEAQENVVWREKQKKMK